MKADEFARRLDDMRRRVHDIRKRTALPSEAVDELLRAVEELSIAEEELRQQNEALAAAHQALEEERARYQHLFQYAPDAYLLTDLGGVIREANLSAARLLNVKPRFMVGKALVSFVALEDRARVRGGAGPVALGADSQGASRSGSSRGSARPSTRPSRCPWRGAGRGTRPSASAGSCATSRLSASSPRTSGCARRTPAARPRPARPSARHVQKLESIGVLAGGIAHDFNNLLHVVLGNADLARLQLPAEAPAREHLDEVVRATQRAAELTQQLLAYSGRGAVEIRHLDLSDEVREMATLLRTAISKQATLVWDLAPDLPPSAPIRPRCARS